MFVFLTFQQLLASAPSDFDRTGSGPLRGRKICMQVISHAFVLLHDESDIALNNHSQHVDRQCRLDLYRRTVWRFDASDIDFVDSFLSHLEIKLDSHFEILS
jgi:hypothetical protein